MQAKVLASQCQSSNTTHRISSNNTDEWCVITSSNESSPSPSLVSDDWATPFIDLVNETEPPPVPAPTPSSQRLPTKEGRFPDSTSDATIVSDPWSCSDDELTDTDILAKSPTPVQLELSVTPPLAGAFLLDVVSASEGPFSLPSEKDLEKEHNLIARHGQLILRQFQLIDMYNNRSRNTFIDKPYLGSEKTLDEARDEYFEKGHSSVALTALNRQIRVFNNYLYVKTDDLLPRRRCCPLSFW